MNEQKQSRKWLWIAIAIGACVLALPCIGIVAAIALPSLIGARGKAQQARASYELAQIGAAIEMYRMANAGRAPASLDVLVTPDENGVRYMDNHTAVPLDPWKNPYRYEPSAEAGRYRVFSYGSDGAPGGEGDAADVESHLGQL